MNQFALCMCYTSRTGWGNGSPPPVHHGTGVITTVPVSSYEQPSQLNASHSTSLVFLRVALLVPSAS